MIEEKKQLSFNIKRTEVKGFKCYYQYEFSTNQWLESIDKIFDLNENDIKEKVIDSLVNEFKIALNNVVFGDPAGRFYIENKDKC